MNKDRQQIARCIVRVIDAVLGVMGEGRLTEGQGRVMAALLARMVSREFLRALARALRIDKPDEREAEVRYLVTVMDVGRDKETTLEKARGQVRQGDGEQDAGGRRHDADASPLGRGSARGSRMDDGTPSQMSKIKM